MFHDGINICALLGLSPRKTHGRGLLLGLPQTWEGVPGSGQVKVPLIGPSRTRRDAGGDTQHGLFLRHRPRCSVRHTPAEKWVESCRTGRRKATYRFGFVSPQPLEVCAKSGHGTTAWEDMSGSGQFSVPDCIRLQNLEEVSAALRMACFVVVRSL